VSVGACLEAKLENEWRLKKEDVGQKSGFVFRRKTIPAVIIRLIVAAPYVLAIEASVRDSLEISRSPTFRLAKAEGMCSFAGVIIKAVAPT
jgi:hypothetical protein